MMPGISCFGQDRHDYKIYSTLIEELCRHESVANKTLIIDQDSDTTLIPGDPFHGGEPVLPELLAALDQLMQKRIRFDNKFKVTGWQTLVITHKEYLSLIMDEKGDWIDEELYRKYPNAEGIIRLSPIYYSSADRTTGVVQMSFRRNSMKCRNVSRYV
ncbi:MAG: hypothetical protein QM762_04445 [Chryseolinea sp.]